MIIAFERFVERGYLSYSENLSLALQRARRKKLPSKALPVASLDFRSPSLAGYRAEGLSFPESWGRWTVGPEVTLDFPANLPLSFTLSFTAYAFQENATLQTVIVAGNVVKEIIIGPAPAATYFVRIECEEPVKSIRLSVPRPTRPIDLWPDRTDDSRSLGLALTRVEIYGV